VFPEIIAASRAQSPPGLGARLLDGAGGLLARDRADRVPRDHAQIRPPIQIFATDLNDQNALDKARAGVFPEGIEAGRVARAAAAILHSGDHRTGSRNRSAIICVFARQNVTSDPPFSHLDLISCRNLLIYLASPLQKRVLPAFHYALNSPGFLVLGNAETVGENTDLFELVDRSNKIYAKKPTASRPPLYFPEEFKSVGAVALRRSGASPPSPVEFEREATASCSVGSRRPAVLVNENLDIIQFRGRTSPFLEPPPGEPTTSLLKMAREGLFLELRSVLAEVKQHKRPSRRDACACA
jgi:two-component system CheB/CheR fusion protein